MPPEEQIPRTEGGLCPCAECHEGFRTGARTTSFTSGILEQMRSTPHFDMSTGNTVVESGTIDIKAEVVEPMRLNQ
jgi:hypothetical protein